LPLFFLKILIIEERNKKVGNPVMYCSFYGIAEKPFSITPDPKFLYLGKTHKEAFAHLLYGIRERGGFIVITGEIGAGKTTLCRGLLSHLDEDTLVAFIFNPTLSALELLKGINEDFGIPSEGTTKKELIDELNQFLLEKRKEGKNTVLIIDESQSLDGEVLEQIRLLSNLETETEKLLQIILIGQPEFRHILEQPRLLQLNQRVTVRYHLHALSAEETAEYIHHRLSVIDGEERIFFTPEAVKKIWRYTRGVPRLINVLCDRALLAGYGQRKKTIDGRMVDQARREVTGRSAWAGPLDVLRTVRRGLVPASLLGILLLLLMIGLRDYLGEDRNVQGVDAHEGRNALEDDGAPLLSNEAVSSHTSGHARETAAQVPDRAGALARVSTSPDTRASALESSPQKGGIEERPEGAAGSEGGQPTEELPPAAPGRETSLPGTPAMEPADFGMSPEAIEERVLSALYARTLLETREEAFLAVLQKWGSGLSAEEELKRYRDAPDLYKAARALGFQCLRFRGNINRLRALNLPALLELRLGETMTKRYVALLAFEGAHGRITPYLRDGSPLVPLGVLESLWYGTAYVLWKDAWGGRRYLAKGMKGGSIGQLQSSLKDLGYYEWEPSGVFDKRTAEAVVAFQRDHFLDEDGILGPQTRIVLYQALKRFEMPTLTGSS
jgi:general secretion pathway protein A